MKKPKLFLCFRPFPIETEQQHQPDATARRNQIESAVKNPVLNTTSRSSKSGRSFSRILKSILFESSLKESVKNKTSKGISRSRKLDKCFQNSDEFVSPNFSYSSSSPPVPSSEPRKTYDEKKQSEFTRSKSGVVGDCPSSYKGLYLILITLCITILCGKVYAILLMSLWVMCCPRRRRSERLEAEKEKRLVMMIHKNHHHQESINVCRETEF